MDADRLSINMTNPLYHFSQKIPILASVLKIKKSQKGLSPKEWGMHLLT